MPRSTYYYTKHSQGRKYDDDQVIQAIDEIRQTDAKYTQKYGYRRITLVMHEQGFKVNHKRVLRIMKEQGWRVSRMLCKKGNFARMNWQF